MPSIDPKQSADQLVKALSKMSAADAAAYIKTNYASIDPKALTAVVDWAAKQYVSLPLGDPGKDAMYQASQAATRRATNGSDPKAAGAAADMAVTAAKGGKVNKDTDGDGTVSPTEAAAVDDNLQQVADQRVASGPGFNPDLDGDGQVSPKEKADLDVSTTNLAKKQAAQSGNSVAQEKASVNKALDPTGTGGLTDPTLAPPPAAIMQYLGSQRPLTTKEAADLISTFNEAHPDQPVTNINDVYQRLGVLELDPVSGTRREGSLTDPDSIALVEKALLGKEPQISYTVRLAGGKDYVVSSTELKAWQGFSDHLTNEDLTGVVRAADRFGIKDSTGEKPAWQMLAAVMKAKGMDFNADRLYTADDPKTTTIPAAVHPPMTGTPTTDPLAVWKQPATGPTPIARNWNAVDPDARQAYSSGYGLSQVALKYKEGQSLYGGNMILAFVHSLNPSLAARWATTKPSDRTAQDQIQMNQYLANGGFTDKTFMGLGITGGDANSLTAEWDAQRFAKPDTAGGTRSMPDPVAVRQTARDMYVKMFASEPSDSQLAQLVGVVNGAIGGAADNQNVDATAQLQQALQGTGTYKELYGHKPAGMSDEEYKAQFDNGASEMLGAQAPDPSVIRAGMSTGDYQTTVGAVAGTKQAWSNSTFLGRLAQASQLVSANS